MVRRDLAVIETLQRLAPQSQHVLVSLESWTGGNASKVLLPNDVSIVRLPRPSGSSQPIWMNRRRHLEIALSAPDLSDFIERRVLPKQKAPFIVCIDGHELVSMDHLISTLQSLLPSVDLWVHLQHSCLAVPQTKMRLARILFRAMRAVLGALEQTLYKGVVAVALDTYRQMRLHVSIKRQAHLRLFSSTDALEQASPRKFKTQDRVIGDLHLDGVRRSKARSRYHPDLNGVIIFYSSGDLRLTDSRRANQMLEALCTVKSMASDFAEVYVKLKSGELPFFEAAPRLDRELRSLTVADDDLPIHEVAPNNLVVACDASTVVLECLALGIPFATYTVGRPPVAARMGLAPSVIPTYVDVLSGSNTLQESIERARLDGSLTRRLHEKFGLAPSSSCAVEAAEAILRNAECV